MWLEQGGGPPGGGQQGVLGAVLFSEENTGTMALSCCLSDCSPVSIFIVVLCFGFWGVGERVAIRARGVFS